MSSTEPTTESGITSKSCTLSVNDTVAKLTGLIESRGMKLFAVIDQASEAAEVGLSLRPTVLVVFGSPLAGTPVMDAFPLAGLDLPLKVLVWADQEQTTISYLSPDVLAARFHLPADLARNLAGIEPLTDALVAS